LRVIFVVARIYLASSRARKKPGISTNEWSRYW